MFAIVVNEKGGEQKRLEFDKPEVTIGRVQGNDIILPKGNVSKRHSRIVLKDGKFIIVDLKSTNGTYVNGRKITSPLVVKGSDKIYIGDFILSIEEAQGAAVADEGLAPPPPPRKAAPSIPPPPPRRAPTQPQEDFEAQGEPGPTDDEQPQGDEGESTPPPPPDRPARPSTPAVQPAPLPPVAPPRPAPAPIVARAPISEPPRPAPRPDFPAPAPAPAAVRSTLSGPRPASMAGAPAPAPAPAPAAAAAPAPAANRRPTPAAVPQPTRRSMSTVSVDDGKRAKLSEVMRELSARLTAALGGVDARSAGEDLWSRAENAAADLVEQAATDGSLPAGVDTDALLKDVVAETVGLGPLEEYLGDDTVREVTIARHDRIFVDKGGQVSLAGKWFSSADAVTRAVERLLHRAGRSDDLERARANGALVEARIDGGLLLTAALPPLAARGPSVSIRRPRRNVHKLADLVGEGLLSQSMADFLDLAVKSRRNIVVSGPPGSGRSTVLQALARAAEGERVVSVEEAEEIDLGDGHWIPLL